MYSPERVLVTHETRELFQRSSGRMYCMCSEEMLSAPAASFGLCSQKALAAAQKLHKGTGHCAVKNSETIATHIFLFGTHYSRDTTHCTSHAHDIRHDMSDHTLGPLVARAHNRARHAYRHAQIAPNPDPFR